ncbi:hypothetical protein ACFYVR_25040 [Rhodococcus sp. NPDC003318]|uniref:hypothetical protein n=1 Tax=Rhodococcus sp. NPDC003318 TaxID=3364503 RepID=UPI0036781121
MPDFSTLSPKNNTPSVAGPATAGSAKPSLLASIPRWQKIAFAALVLLGVIAIISASCSGGSSETSSVRTSHGPTDIVDGVPTGYSRDEAGARTAAINFITATEQAAQGRISIEAVTEHFVASSPTDSLNAVLKSSTNRPDAERTVMNSQPAIVNLAEYSDDAATVSVWAMTVGQSDLDGEGKVGVLTTWSTTTVGLVWEDGDWKAKDWAFKTGPTPEQARFPADDSSLAQLGAGGLYSFFVE